MTVTLVHAIRRTGRNAPHATGKKAKSRRVVGTIHQKSADPRLEFSDEEWREMVATAAYYRAESRGFDGGSPEDDWYEAEAELRERFSAAGDQIEAISNSGGGANNIETNGK